MVENSVNKASYDREGLGQYKLQYRKVQQQQQQQPHTTTPHHPTYTHQPASHINATPFLPQHSLNDLACYVH
ncbi:hypothetical protein E2C01_021410 [Portunus trituberculatus]|uniref:Uncharacterized protein n=1 Tax=Portunus trituberculatus TaxID=210409 RepID=A0A5B7E603_PORTR|nr:hypothetical protein [Portunus trituberculatus]